MDYHTGFTPAYAGNTNTGAGPQGTEGVHPRIRGEYHHINSRFGRWKGSPPHTRGIRGVSSFQEVLIRFTPAYAGNTNGSGVAP